MVYVPTAIDGAGSSAGSTAAVVNYHTTRGRLRLRASPVEGGQAARGRETAIPLQACLVQLHVCTRTAETLNPVRRFSTEVPSRLGNDRERENITRFPHRVQHSCGIFEHFECFTAMGFFRFATGGVLLEVIHYSDIGDYCTTSNAVCAYCYRSTNIICDLQTIQEWDVLFQWG